MRTEVKPKVYIGGSMPEGRKTRWREAVILDLLSILFWLIVLFLILTLIEN